MGRLQSLLSLVQEQHPEEELIKTKQDEVNAAWQRLKGLALQRQGKLFGAAEVQRFNRYRAKQASGMGPPGRRLARPRSGGAAWVWLPALDRRCNCGYTGAPFCRDVDETISWIKEKEQLMASDDFGRDLASVQALLRKHEGLERDLAALEDKVGFEADSLNESVGVKRAALKRCISRSKPCAQRPTACSSATL